MLCLSFAWTASVGTNVSAKCLHSGYFGDLAADVEAIQQSALQNYEGQQEAY